MSFKDYRKHDINKTSKPQSDIGYTPMRRKDFTNIFLRRMEKEWLPLIEVMLDQAYKGNTKILLYLVDYCLTPPDLLDVDETPTVNCLQDARNLGKRKLESLLNTFIIEMN